MRFLHHDQIADNVLEPTPRALPVRTRPRPCAPRRGDGVPAIVGDSSPWIHLANQVIVLTFASLCPFMVSAQPNGNGPSTDEREESGLTLERFQKISGAPLSRRISIDPRRPQTGISSGTVMAYGHPMAPPYNIEYIGDHLLINGVQVLPSLVKERHRRSRPVREPSAIRKSATAKAGGLIQKAKDLHAANHGKMSEEALHQKILDALRGHGEVQSPRWQKEALCFSVSGYDGTECVNFGHSLFSQPEIQTQNEEKNRSERVAQIEARLKEGKWVCFGSMGQMAIRANPRSAVREIMADGSLSREERIERLHKHVLRNYDLALDVSENYATSEWQSDR